MKPKYKVVVVGMGKRGLHHATAFQANGRFEVAGICDSEPPRLPTAERTASTITTSRIVSSRSAFHRIEWPRASLHPTASHTQLASGVKSLFEASHLACDLDHHEAMG